MANSHKITENSSIPVLLTFDDGPHAGGPASNLTRKIAATLKTNPFKNGIVAVFFLKPMLARVAGRVPKCGSDTPRGRRPRSRRPKDQRLESVSILMLVEIRCNHVELSSKHRFVL